MNNLGEFNRCTVVLFDALYDSFPVPLRLNAYNLDEGLDAPKVVLFTKEDRYKGDNDSAVKSALLTYRWTIHFWINEGLMRNVHDEHLERMAKFKGTAPYGDSDPSLFPSVTLTARGLDALNASPDLIKGKPVPFIQRIKQALVDQSTDYIAKTVTELIKTVITVGVL